MKKRAETIMRSAEKRLDEALLSFRGDAEYYRDELHVATLEADARYDTPPHPSVRRKLIPNWAWWKRFGR